MEELSTVKVESLANRIRYIFDCMIPMSIDVIGTKNTIEVGKQGRRVDIVVRDKRLLNEILSEIYSIEDDYIEIIVIVNECKEGLDIELPKIDISKHGYSITVINGKKIGQLNLNKMISCIDKHIPIQIQIRTDVDKVIANEAHNEYANIVLDNHINGAVSSIEEVDMSNRKIQINGTQLCCCKKVIMNNCKAESSSSMRIFLAQMEGEVYVRNFINENKGSYLAKIESIENNEKVEAMVIKSNRCSGNGVVVIADKKSYESLVRVKGPFSMSRNTLEDARRAMDRAKKLSVEIPIEMKYMIVHESTV